MFESGDLGPGTLVWSESLEGWTRASEVEAFKSKLTTSYLSQSQKPPPALGSEPEIKAKPETIYVPIKGNRGITKNYWYYRKDSKREGPIPESELLEMIEAGDLDPRALVRTEAMKYWRPVPHIKSLRVKIESSLPPSNGRLLHALPQDQKRVWVIIVEKVILGLVILFVAMLGIPGFVANQKKALTSEAKQELDHIRNIERTYKAEKLMYGSLADIGWVEPTGKKRYTYSISYSSTTFLARATGNIDRDNTIDTWAINQNNTLNHTVDDIKN